MQPVGEFSRSLERVIIQGLPLTAAASVYTQPSRPPPPPNLPPAPPSPKPLSRPTLVARPPGHAGIEQLLLRSNISTKTTRGERECKGVGTERTKTTTKKRIACEGTD